MDSEEYEEALMGLEALIDEKNKRIAYQSMQIAGMNQVILAQNAKLAELEARATMWRESFDEVVRELQIEKATINALEAQVKGD